MKPIKCLYQIHSDDNVATALGDLDEGDVVPVCDSEGMKKAELTLLSHVPRFFKVAILPLKAGEDVVKWGCPIGQIPKGIGDVELEIRVGSVVHVGNFVASAEFIAHWGDAITMPSSVIISAARASAGRKARPVEVGKTQRSFKPKDRIFAGEILFDADIGERLVPPGLQGAVIGYALETIKNKGVLHLGAMIAPRRYAYPGRKQEVDLVKGFYHFLKGRVHAIS